MEFLNDIEEMEFHYNKLQTLTSYGGRRSHLDACIYLYENSEETHHYFVYRPHQQRLEMRFERRVLINDLNCPFTNITDRKELPEYKISCYNVSLPYDICGLYFLGDIKYDPTYGKIFLIKIGCSSNLIKRVNSYLTHNPMFYCDNTILPYGAYEKGESNAHEFLARVAIGRPTYSKEWFIVDETTYFELCEKFKDHQFFRDVAEGKYNI